MLVRLDTVEELEGFCRRVGGRRCTGSVTAASRDASPERIEEKREPGRGVRGLWRGRGARRGLGRGLGGLGGVLGGELATELLGTPGRKTSREELGWAGWRGGPRPRQEVSFSF